jgi:transmembrane sensor
MAGEATIQELEELDKLMAAHPEWKRLAGHLLTNDDTPPATDDAEAAWAAHAANLFLGGRFEETEPTAPKKSYRVLITIGIAALLVITAGTWWLYQQKMDRPLVTNEVSTKKGSMSYVKLPDGTQVWLNTNTRLTYNGNFTGALREVTLSGEAYFDVTKDSSRPFIIHTDKLNIKVLGTAFNVKSYPDDETQETALIHGRIEVTLNDRPQEKIILNPNEKLVVRNNQAETAINKAGTPAAPKVTLNNISMAADSVVIETAWLHNKIAFTDESLLHISRMLERKFDVQFQFNHEELKTWSYTGIYESESLEKILELLSTSQKFEYTIQDRQVIISK